MPPKRQTRSNQPVNEPFIGPSFSTPARGRKSVKKGADLDRLEPSDVTSLEEAKKILARLEAEDDQGSDSEEPVATTRGTYHETDNGMANDMCWDTLDAHDEAPQPDNVDWHWSAEADEIVSIEPPVFATEPNPETTYAPTKKTRSLFQRWSETIQTLDLPLLRYLEDTHGQELGYTPQLHTSCTSHHCSKTTSEIVCLSIDHFRKREVISCDCQSLLYVLVRNGFFPSTPSRPRLAASINLLNLYQALFAKSCDAVNALSHALNIYYSQRGFYALQPGGKPMADPFRKSLGIIILWYQVLLDYIEKRTENCVAQAYSSLEQQQPQDSEHTDLEPMETEEAEPEHVETEKLPTAHRLLQNRCPACFGGVTYGKPLTEGGDVQVCIDGNFNHRHRRKVKNCPVFCQPEYILPKAQVDDMGEFMNSIKHPRSNPRPLVVPDEAIDECRDAHTAGSGSNEKTNLKTFDDGGLMALVCRHDVPLFVANIDTPGEQQKYGVSLIEHLMSLLPNNATVFVLYDVGCVLDRSLALYAYLPDEVTNRLGFATSAMHAYVHQWACQIAYNPRFQPGLGLTDGEGVERLWSRMRKLIGITRGCARNRRLWLIDQFLAMIRYEHHGDLGAWIIRKMKQVVEQEGSAQKNYHKCGINEKRLRAEWKDQQDTQVSVSAHAPVRLKKELDTVLDLQMEADGLQRKIILAKKCLSEPGATPHAAEVDLKLLLETHDDFNKLIEGLYSSLNVEIKFPELKGSTYEFVRILLQARDLKINIRKRAIGSFFEWDRLHQAQGGRNQAIGTKAHQATRQAISKRAPALQTAICKFNGYCDELEQLYDPAWGFSLPEKLPEEISKLRECPHLMEDVWVDRTGENTPAWISNFNVREGIRAVLRLDRCSEERIRLCLEARNLLRWFGREFTAVQIAIGNPLNKGLLLPLQKRKDYLLGLGLRWAVPGVTNATQFHQKLLEAQHHADVVLGQAETCASVVPTITPFKVEAYFDEELDDIDATTLEAQGIDPEEITISDLISDTFSAEEDGDLESVLVSDAAFRATVQPAVQIIWQLPHDHCEQENLFHSLQEAHQCSPLANTYSNTHAERRFTMGTRQIVFSQEDITRLANPSACLDDICLNDVGKLLHKIYSLSIQPSAPLASSCALFSTYILPQSRLPGAELSLWRQTSHLQFWLKPTWLFPIHRPASQPGGVGHWVLCTVSVASKRVFLFDSFAGQDAWRQEVPEIVRLVCHLLRAANREGYQLLVELEGIEDGWKAQPTLVVPHQNNGVDCGYWVLAAVVAVLNGYTGTGIDEAGIPKFREYILHYVLSIPVFS